MNADLVEASPAAIKSFESAKDEPNSDTDLKNDQDSRMQASHPVLIQEETVIQESQHQVDEHMDDEGPAA